jgi:hypothetical protein
MSKLGSYRRRCQTPFIGLMRRPNLSRATSIVRTPARLSASAEKKLRATRNPRQSREGGMRREHPANPPVEPDGRLSRKVTTANASFPSRAGRAKRTRDRVESRPARDRGLHAAHRHAGDRTHRAQAGTSARVSRRSRQFDLVRRRRQRTAHAAHADDEHARGCDRMAQSRARASTGSRTRSA